MPYPTFGASCNCGISCGEHWNRESAMESLRMHWRGDCNGYPTGGTISEQVENPGYGRRE